MNNIFLLNISQKQTQLKQIETKLNQIAFWRLVSFLFFVITIIYFANAKQFVLTTLVALFFLPVFLWLIKIANQLQLQKQFIKNFITINETEQKIVAFNRNDLDDTDSFINDITHNYIQDLDIFTKNGLFSLLNRTVTDLGKDKLVKWLSEKAKINTILQRQNAVKELVNKTGFCQTLRTWALCFRSKKTDEVLLKKWLLTTYHSFDHLKYKLWVIFSPIIIITISILFFSTGNQIFIIFFMIALVANRLLLNTNPVRETIDKVLEHIKHNAIMLRGYINLIETIQNENFSDSYLLELKNKLHNPNYQTLKEIKNLNFILSSWESRGLSYETLGKNLFYPFLNSIFILDLIWFWQAEKWKAKSQNHLVECMGVIAEFEALNSLAGFAFLNPEYVFPKIANEYYILKLENTGHPLISHEKRVVNDFSLEKQGQIALITGSNMAGKSTFLRTIGINVVLALTGAPVCATYMEVGHLNVFTSMRTQDNLLESTSSFYAELKRLEKLLILIKNGEPILFLLDEILKGTNSVDRNKGGKALIKQLSKLNTFGFIATHDLELGHLSDNDKNVQNYSFNSQVQDGQVSFNYRITKGVCQEANASLLMKTIGIEIEND